MRPAGGALRSRRSPEYSGSDTGGRPCSTPAACLPPGKHRVDLDDVVRPHEAKAVPREPQFGPVDADLRVEPDIAVFLDRRGRAKGQRPGAATHAEGASDGNGRIGRARQPDG